MRWNEFTNFTIWLTIFGLCSNAKEINNYLTRSNKRCWGFESDCKFNESYSVDHVKCRKKSKWPSIRSNAEQIDAFWRAGDFGLIKKIVNSMKVICQSDSNEKSFLQCSDHLRFCRGKNIFFDLRNFNAATSARYRSDIIQMGQVGGYCDAYFHPKFLKTNDQKGYLQSWAMELQHFQSVKSFNFDSCDFVFEKPTFVIKLDASVNMYHHFCDFINLFASQFVNGTFFGQDVDVLWWDTYSGGFVDSIFGAVWQAFSFNKPFELIDFNKKKICFRDVTFSLLARQVFGLYYNMPLVDGCTGSGLFHVFSHHLLDRLVVKQNELLLDKVRITILQRQTRFRRILNINELLQNLIELPNAEVKMVSYDRNISFIEQLKITHNTDIFIGMHGSGLTHMLFLPDWAAVLELHNCGDQHCYKDLARLRGIKYWTWTRENKVFPEDEGHHPDTGMSHQKFTNYAFDVFEFKKIVLQMIEYVLREPKFVIEQRKLRRKKATTASKIEL